MVDNETGERVVVEKEENFNSKIAFIMKSQYNYQPLFAWIIIFAPRALWAQLPTLLYEEE